MSVGTTVVSRICPDCKKSYPFKENHVCEVAAKPSEPPKETDPLVGAILGDRYQITSFLSSGGMGVVYKGRHVVLDKPVAIKLLRESQDETAQQRFLLEAKSACHIAHEHIVDITDFGVLEDGRPYLVMEFLQGQSLETQLSRGGALPIARVCRIGEQIARGLQAVHEKGILHRDLKPGNIFLLDRQKKDFVKILDFGIAKVMAGTRDSLTAEPAKELVSNMRQTTQGVVLGTPEYLSPEQAAGEAFDSRVDIYALGIILYEMVTGEVPFRGNGPMSTLMKHLSETAVPPRKRRPELGIPESFERIVLRAMAREKDARYASMEDLANALQAEQLQFATLSGDTSGVMPAMSSSALVVPPRAVSNTTTVRNRIGDFAANNRQRLIQIGAAAGAAIAILTLVLLIISLRGKKPKQPLTDNPDGATNGQKADGGEKAGGEKTPPAPKPTQLVFQNDNGTPVIVSCSGAGQEPCKMPKGKQCSFTIEGPTGKCEAYAPGYLPLEKSFAELHTLAEKSQGKATITVKLTPKTGGKSGPKTGPKPSGKTPAKPKGKSKPTTF